MWPIFKHNQPTKQGIIQTLGKSEETESAKNMFRPLLQCNIRNRKNITPVRYSVFLAIESILYLVLHLDLHGL